ncbi:LysR family transcriptional regulator [Rhodopseudomonas sp. B29]|uniref:LysR family transcriptional regulator n=1 Tax=Rhodopseudomonas sp. B29 TaxID=95607 RepID=UPI0003B639A7|nr:LysR family transcriptional regulator [Rhodopseudomonas sp. B29]
MLRLLAFVRVVEAGSFAEAARRAGTTTSAMSKAVARFEQAHGMRLLHRSTHSLALTEEGDRLMEAGRALAESLAHVQSALGEVARDGGRVCVTAPASFARACILPRLPVFLQERPEIEIEVKFRNEILDLTAEGVDIAIRSGPLGRAPGHQARRLCTFSWIACASPAYLNARGAPTTPYELSAHDHVGFRNPANGQILNWRFTDPRGKAPVRFAPKPKHICDDAHASLALVEDGFGVGWGPEWLVREGLRTGRLVEVLAPWRAPAEALWMLRTTDRRPPLRTQRVMSFLATLPAEFSDKAG